MPIVMGCIPAAERTYHGSDEAPHLRREAPFFEGKNPVLIYIAKRLGDAKRLEETLTSAGIDYGVEADEYRGGVVFRSARVGAFFYVLGEAAGPAHSIMQANGFTPHREEDQRE